MNKNTLHAAHNQWANRPADETFPSIQELHQFVLEQRNNAATARTPFERIRVEADNGSVKLVGGHGRKALMTNWSFGQLASRIGAPPSYLRQLPATLAAQNLNYGLAALNAEGEEEREASLLLDAKTGSVRAINSDKYSRIWNCHVTDKLVRLVETQPNWKLPLAYDRHGGTRGTPDANGMVPRGAYASDRDMFVFMVDEGRELAVPGSNPVNRGFFMRNSEVGAASFEITTFIYDYVCGNHYVWGASNVNTIRIRHIGEARPRAFEELAGKVRDYAESSGRLIESQIVKARTLLLGDGKEDVVAKVLGRRIADLPKWRVEDAYDIAEKTPRYGDPRSVWGIVSGLTELAQDATNTDDRTANDRAAGKLLEIAF